MKGDVEKGDSIIDDDILHKVIEAGDAVFNLTTSSTSSAAGSSRPSCGSLRGNW